MFTFGENLSVLDIWCMRVLGESVQVPMEDITCRSENWSQPLLQLVLRRTSGRSPCTYDRQRLHLSGDPLNSSCNCYCRTFNARGRQKKKKNLSVPVIEPVFLCGIILTAMRYTRKSKHRRLMNHKLAVLEKNIQMAPMSFPTASHSCHLYDPQRTDVKSAWTVLKYLFFGLFCKQ